MHTESDITKELRGRKRVASPPSDHKFRLPACNFAAGLPRPAAVTFEAFMANIVVPTGQKLLRRLYFLMTSFHAVRFPDLVEAVLLNDLVIRRPIGKFVQRRHGRQPAVNFLHIDGSVFDHRLIRPIS